MKPANSKPKVLILFPHFNQSDSSHYPYWYTLFNEAANDLDLSIIFESGSSTTKPKVLSNLNQVVFQQHQQKPLNLLERYRLINHFVRQGYNNIYIHYSYWSVILAWLIKHAARRTPARRGGSHVKLFYWNCERYDTKPNDRLLDWCLKHVDVLVTGHQVIADAYRKTFKLGDKPIKIVPNWVKLVTSDQRLAVSEKDKEKRVNILFVHHLSPRKGTRELPIIIKETIKQIPNAQFHIVGDGPDRQYLTSHLSSLISEGKVTFLGNLPLSHVQQLMSETDIFIMPSRSEGFPRVILEAMINQVPFVATDVGCVKNIISVNQLKYIVPVKQPLAFAEAISKLNLLPTVKQQTLVSANYQLCHNNYSLAEANKAFMALFT